jgi:acetyltransferase-like isoleucine patch superfamily enzyme
LAKRRHRLRCGDFAPDISLRGHARLYEAQFSLVAKPISVEDQAWLAAGWFIALGVTVGSGAIINAPSLVLCDMPEGMIYFCYSARPVKKGPGANA